MTGVSGDGATAAGGGSGEQRTNPKQACTVLYAALPPLDSGWMQRLLARVVGDGCTVEWARARSGGVPLVAGTAQWGEHRLVMIALEAPVKQDVLARTVGVSPMPEEQRAKLIAHEAAIRVLYMGDAEDPIEQLRAMYVLAGVLLSLGGLGLINEQAALALPTELAAVYMSDLWSETPPISLWVGVVTFGLDEDETEEGLHSRYLMRTYGMAQMGLPELGTFMQDRSVADVAYHALLNICLYMVEGRDKLQMEAGHRAEFGGRTFLLTEAPTTGDEFASPTGLFVLVEV